MRAEQFVDRSEYLRPRAVVARQRQQLLRLRAPLAEDGDVSVAEAVDRLELVTDEEELRRGTAQQVDELALQAVRVLELVDHDRPEAQLLAPPRRAGRGAALRPFVARASSRPRRSGTGPRRATSRVALRAAPARRARARAPGRPNATSRRRSSASGADRRSCTWREAADD